MMDVNLNSPADVRVAGTKVLVDALVTSILPSWPLSFYYALDHGWYTTGAKEGCASFPA